MNCKFVKYALCFALLALCSTLLGYVDLSSGALILPVNDVDKSLHFTRTYNSQSSKEGWFGRGWSSWLEQKLLFTQKDGITLTRATDSQGEYFKRRNLKVDEWVSNSGEVIKKNNTGYVRKLPSGVIFLFSHTGDLFKITLADKSELLFSYKHGNPYKIMHSNLSWIIIDWKNNKVDKVSTSLKESVSYHYNGNELVLVEYKNNPSAKKQYRYDSFSNLLNVSGPSKESLVVTYIPKDGKVKTYQEYGQGKYLYSYTKKHNSPYVSYITTRKHRLETITNEETYYAAKNLLVEEKLILNGKVVKRKTYANNSSESKSTSALTSLGNRRPAKLIVDGVSVNYNYNKNEMVSTISSKDHFVVKVLYSRNKKAKAVFVKEVKKSKKHAFRLKYDNRNRLSEIFVNKKKYSFNGVYGDDLVHKVGLLSNLAKKYFKLINKAGFNI